VGQQGTHGFTPSAVFGGVGEDARAIAGVSGRRIPFGMDVMVMAARHRLRFPSIRIQGCHEISTIHMCMITYHHRGGKRGTRHASKAWGLFQAAAVVPHEEVYIQRQELASSLGAKTPDQAYFDNLPQAAAA